MIPKKRASDVIRGWMPAEKIMLKQQAKAK
jgi:hypothetical protein